MFEENRPEIPQNRSKFLLAVLVVIAVACFFGFRMYRIQNYNRALRETALQIEEGQINRKVIADLKMGVGDRVNLAELTVLDGNKMPQGSPWFTLPATKNIAIDGESVVVTYDAGVGYVCTIADPGGSMPAECIKIIVQAFAARSIGFAHRTGGPFWVRLSY